MIYNATLDREIARRLYDVMWETSNKYRNSSYYDIIDDIIEELGQTDTVVLQNIIMHGIHSTASYRGKGGIFYAVVTRARLKIKIKILEDFG